MTIGNDPTRPATLPGYLSELGRRVTEIERANPIARASFHDGTRTRAFFGSFSHPDDANPEMGLRLLSASGSELLLVDDDKIRVGVLLTISGSTVSLTLPTSAGSAGELWNNGGVVSVS